MSGHAPYWGLATNVFGVCSEPLSTVSQKLLSAPLKWKTDVTVVSGGTVRYKYYGDSFIRAKLEGKLEKHGSLSTAYPMRTNSRASMAHKLINELIN